ncbi:hypothetical protein BDZ45DRAFT_744970 [Acephala macrosclerotiorum]|nr:hypothetical protein BDZ45DRAFT_744970 [Acephala macrosclerotiorum]
MAVYADLPPSRMDKSALDVNEFQSSQETKSASHNTNPSKRADENGERGYEDSPAPKRIRLDGEEALVGHHISEPQLPVYARITNGGHLVYRPHREEVSAAIKARVVWDTLVSQNGVIRCDNVMLNDDVLKGAVFDLLSESERKQLTRDYLQSFTLEQSVEEKPTSSQTNSRNVSRSMKNTVSVRVSLTRNGRLVYRLVQVDASESTVELGHRSIVRYDEADFEIGMDQGDEESTNKFLKAALRAQIGVRDTEDEDDKLVTGSENPPSAPAKFWNNTHATSQVAGPDLLTTLESHEEASAALGRVVRNYDSEVKSLQKTINSLWVIINKQKTKIAEYKNTIEAVRAPLGTADAAFATYKTAIPSSLRFQPSQHTVASSKLYTRIAAGMPNEGVYVQTEGRIKDSYRERFVLSPYNRFDIGEVLEEAVMVKNIEFCRTATGLVQKQEEFVEIDGKTYISRRIRTAYESDEE